MTITGTSRLPYPGLRAYARDETDLFFGREECVNEMVDRLAATHFLAVLGASGSGKSSLVRTGLLDAVEIGMLPDAGVSWAIAECHPGSTPTRNLASALLAARGGATNDAFSIDALESFLRRGPLSVVEWQKDGHLRPGQNLLLLIDQFEELFRYGDYAGREEAEAFVALLLESASSGGPIYVVLTMRSEYLGACALIPEFAEQINESIYLTRRMTLEECREAILGPAAVLGFTIEPRLVTRLLNDLASFAPWDNDGTTSQLERLSRQADQLPLMQHVLNRLWLRAASDHGDGPVTLTLADYLAIGQLQGALDQHGAEIMDGLGEATRPAVEAVFRGLIAGPSLGSAVRKPTRLQDLEALAGGDPGVVRTIVEAFRGIGANFLRPPATEPLHDGTLVDISHESLIRQWSLLAGWLQKEARDSAMWRRLQSDAKSEQDGERQLLTGIDLANVQAWWDRNKPSAAWAARHHGQFETVSDFLARSSQQERATYTEAERQGRRARNRAWAVAGALLVLLVGALAGGGLYYRSEGEVLASNVKLIAANEQAERDREAANHERDAAQRATGLAIDAADRFLSELTSQFQDTAAIPPEKLRQILSDGDQFLSGMSTEIGDSPRLAWVQARLLLKFAELSLADDIEVAAARLDHARTILAEPSVAKMPGSFVLQAKAYRLGSAIAFERTDWSKAEAEARQAISLFDGVAPLQGDARLVASLAHQSLSRALWMQTRYDIAQNEANACLATLAGANPSKDERFADAGCLHAKALAMGDAAEAAGDPLGMQSAQEIYRQETIMLKELMAGDETNVAYKDLMAKVLNNTAGQYRAKDPMLYVRTVEEAAAVAEQALERAAWSASLKFSIQHYDYWVGKVLHENGKPIEALGPLARARELDAELVRMVPTNTGWQNNYDYVLTEARSAYIDAGSDKLRPAEKEAWVQVGQTLLERHVAKSGGSPADEDSLFDIVEDHSRLAEALRAAGRPSEALRQAHLGAELVDGRAFSAGADPRYRYWAHWLRQVECYGPDTPGGSPEAKLALCEDTVSFVADHLVREPRDWLSRTKLANARYVLAGLYLGAGRKAEALAAMRLSAEDGSEDGVRALAKWYRTGEGAAAIDPAEAQLWQDVADHRKWGMKVLTIYRAHFWSHTATDPALFYIRDPASADENTLEEEIYRVEVIEGIQIPDTVTSSLRKLWTMAVEKNRSFSELCTEALGTSTTASDRIFAARAGADGTEVEVQSGKDGSFKDMPLAVAAVQAEWTKPDGKKSVKEAFDEIVKRSDEAIESLWNLADALDSGGLPEAAELAMTAIIERITPTVTARELASSYNERANFRERAGRIDDAIQDYTIAAALQPDNAAYANELGYTRLENDVALPATLEMLQRALQLAPDDVDTQESVGWAYVKTGRVEDGLIMLSKVAAASPRAPEPYAHMADGLRRLGRSAEARVALTMAVAHKPSPQLAAFIAQQKTLLGNE